jgi:transposase-like protein
LNTREVSRKYRLNQWTEIVRECRNSGQTVKTWCANHDINPKTYYYWLRRVREAACQALQPLGENSVIVPVNIPKNAVGTDPAAAESSSHITLWFGSVTLELRNNASATLIENTLRALQNVR